MEETFEEYLKQARWDFAIVAEKYLVKEHLELRTAIDSFLIAYDQAVSKALRTPDAAGQSKGVVCDNCEEGKPVYCSKCYEIAFDSFPE